MSISISRIIASIAITFLVACSGSGGSGPADTTDGQQETPQTVDSTASQDTTNDPATPVPTPTTDVTPDGSEDGNPDAPSSGLTRVVFDITVPAYVSDALQVQLTWGDKNLFASWIVDESWSVSDDFPSSTEHPLVITFHDNNSALTLASFETIFATASSSSQSLQVTADQFDTDRWDSDGDGISNLGELTAGTNPTGEDTVEPVLASLELVADKTFRISWTPSATAGFYRVLENPDGVSGFTQIKDDIDASIQSIDHRVTLFDRVNARYIVQACTVSGCADSSEVIVSGTLEQAIGYFKASNHESGGFGRAVGLSEDGTTLAIGKASNVYVFSHSNGFWQEPTVLTASNADRASAFGGALSLSGSGDTLVVSASQENSAATGVNGNQYDSILRRAGAVYVFERVNGNWTQQAYIKASNSDEDDIFGAALSLSADGQTLAVGAPWEDSLATGINGDELDNSADNSGAVYVFARVGDSWKQRAYIKASNTDMGNQFGLGDEFGEAVSLSGNGDTLVVGASDENSAATGINGDQHNDTQGKSGAAYVFVQNNGIWQQQAYLKASNTDQLDHFGHSVSLSPDGNTLAVGAFGENSSATGVNGNQNDESFNNSGAVYVFGRNANSWQQEAYLKASNTEREDLFGLRVSLSGDGNRLAVGTYREQSTARGINGDQSVNDRYESSFIGSGAVYVFERNNGNWDQLAYVKASNTDPGEVTCEWQSQSDTRQASGDAFGRAVTFSGDGKTLAVGADLECSAATGINGNQEDNSHYAAGAVYLY